MARVPGLSAHLREMLKLNNGPSPKRSHRQVVCGFSNSLCLTYTTAIKTTSEKKLIN